MVRFLVTFFVFMAAMAHALPSLILVNNTKIHRHDLNFLIMCTHRRTIVNQYTGKRIVVNCGRCPACLQEKANRYVNRILNTTKDNEIVCFATLTYDNKFVPYFEKSNHDGFHLVIKRDSTMKKLPFSSECVLNDCPEILDTVYLNFSDEMISSCRSLTDKNGCVGVLYFKDAQNFIKRFRENLKNYYGITRHFKWFICGEYGGKLCRPHFHALFWCFSDEYELFRSTFFRSWQFHDLSKIDATRVFEQSRNCASYVASYTNSTSYVPEILRKSPFRPKSTSSRNFGVDSECFSFSQIQEAIERGYLEYDCATSKNGVPTVSTLQIPSYVVNRYFPRFKGYSRLDDNSIFECVANPQRLARFARELKYRYDEFNNDLHRERVKLDNSFYRWCLASNLPTSVSVRHLYAQNYIAAWQAMRRTTFKNFYTSSARNELSSYDNIIDVVDGKAFNESLLQVLETLPSVDSIETDYNRFASLVASSKSLESLYYKKDKSKKVTNYVLQKIYPNF